jgi:hypothetical protein
VSSDPELDQINKAGESSCAKQEDISRRPTGVINIVGVAFSRFDEDMMARKAQEPVTTPPSVR